MPRIFVLLIITLIASPLAIGQAVFNVSEASIVELNTALSQGEVTSVDLVRQYLQRIDQFDLAGPALSAIIRVNPDALTIAAALDEERRVSGPRSLLHGIPIVVKDNYNTTTMATTGGSIALADFLPNAEATQVRKLKDAGAIVLAKTNLHEYAYGITTISSLAGQTRNPYDLRRVPGGSSGGTGAAVAASFAAIGLGSDTCGSIRIPAAFNNLFGLRPSKGLSSIYGIMPLSHTQDVAGPLARTLADLAITLDIVIGFDSNDRATNIVQELALPQFYANLESVNLSDVRLGRLVEYMERADSQVKNAINEALDWYENQGATVVDVEMPQLGELLAASGVIAFEFEADLNRYFEQFGANEAFNLDQIIAEGLHHQEVTGVLTRTSSLEYNQIAYENAIAKRQELKQLLTKLMEEQQLDALVYPPIMELPVLIGESQPGNNCSISANSGLPALSMPVGFTDQGLPVAMELLGKFLEDDSLFALAFDYEKAMQPRQSPAVTPAITNGASAAPISYSVQLDQAGVRILGDFKWDVFSNQLHYSIRSEGSTPASAVTLSVNRDELTQFDEPVRANLLRPLQQSAAGSIFLEPNLRLGLEQKRVYLKVFAPTLPPSGAVVLVQ